MPGNKYKIFKTEFHCLLRMDNDIISSSPLSILLRSQTSSLQQVQSLVEANPELLNPRFLGSVLLISIQEECSGEIILYLLHATFGRDNMMYHELDNDENKEGNDFWKVILMAVLDGRRHISRKVIWQLFKAFPQWIDCHTFLACHPEDTCFLGCWPSDQT